MEPEQYVNTITEEYYNELPLGDKSILREYFQSISEMIKRKRETLNGLSKPINEVMEESVREKCAGMPEERICKIYQIINKAAKFTGQITMDFFAGHDSIGICVHGSRCHYTKEFLFMQISKQSYSAVGKGESGEKVVYEQETHYNPISASRKITNVNIEALKQMKIIELKPDKIHNNKVIYTTVIDDGFKLTAYHTVVEDNYGQCAKLRIYNITRSLLHSLKKGTKIAIVNPYYERGENDLFYYIRQESPDEVVVMLDKPIVNRRNEKGDFISSEEHKEEGNSFFKQKKYEEAIHSYTEAISQNKSNPIFWSNRALCYIRLEQFEKGLSDAEQANQLDSSSDKFKYRMAMAWSGLGDHEKSCEILESIKDVNIEVAAALQKERILFGNTRGEFDFEELARKAELGEEIQIGEFVGPISIQSSSKHGHAVVATRDIQKGELISVSKAIGFVSQSEDKELKKALLLETDPIGNTVRMQTKLLTQSLTQSVTKSKLAAFRIFPLCNKREHQEHIPIEYYTSKGYSYIREKDFPPYQMQQLRDIVCQSELTRTPNVQGCIWPGVWPILLYFNHPCVGNLCKECYRDILVIRACTDIPEGGELIIRFIDLSHFL